MLRNSFAVRSAALAVLFPGQPELSRDRNILFYDEVTKGGLDLPEFSQAGNQVILSSRRVGVPPSQTKVSVDHLGQHLRFLFVDDFPRQAFSLVQQNADSAWEAFKHVWPDERLGGPAVLTEVTIRLTAASEGNNATKFLVEKTLHLPPKALAHLGRGVQGVGLRLMLPVQFDPRSAFPLQGADGNLSVETLLEDQSKLYFEFTAKWPSIAVPPQLVAQGAPAQLNVESKNPSEYLDMAYNYLVGPITDFLVEASV